MLPEHLTVQIGCADACKILKWVFHLVADVIQGRCAAVLMFHTQLALLPAMETEGLELDLMMDDPYGEGMEGPGGTTAELVSATVGNSYVVNLAKMGIKQVCTFVLASWRYIKDLSQFTCASKCKHSPCSMSGTVSAAELDSVGGVAAMIVLARVIVLAQVRDIVFLHKYNEPVLLILHEVEPTWAGRYRDSKDTMALAALSINVVQKRHPRIWEASGLPSDTFKLIPVPTGGALALSQNMIMYHTQVRWRGYKEYLRILPFAHAVVCYHCVFHSCQAASPCPALPCPALPCPALAVHI